MKPKRGDTYIESKNIKEAIEISHLADRPYEKLWRGKVLKIYLGIFAKIRNSMSLKIVMYNILY